MIAACGFDWFTATFTRRTTRPFAPATVMMAWVIGIVVFGAIAMTLERRADDERTFTEPGAGGSPIAIRSVVSESDPHTAGTAENAWAKYTDDVAPSPSELNALAVKLYAALIARPSTVHVRLVELHCGASFESSVDTPLMR